MEEIKLKPCPFCNSEASLSQSVDSDERAGYVECFSIKCTQCYANKGGEFYYPFHHEAKEAAKTPDEAKNRAISSWNTRADEADKARIAALEEALLSPYCGLLVLKTMLRKLGLEAGVKVADEALAELVALHPVLPSRAALRGTP